MKLPLAIIGCSGRLGSTLYREANTALGSANVRAVDRKQLPALESPHAAIYILAVPDRAIAETAKALSANCQAQEAVVMHCSGALASTVLSDFGFMHVASFHPMASFQKGQGTLQGCFVGIEGEQLAREVAFEFAALLGSKPVHISAQKKPLYHSAAVFAANFPAALLTISKRLLVESGLDEAEAESASLALMKSALKNLEQEGIANGLTGPAARKDFETISMHQAALASKPAILALYDLLNEELSRVVKSQKSNN